MAKAAIATYAFCVVANATRPRLRRNAAGLPGMGPVRLLDVDGGLFLAVADAPLDRYGEAAINRGLSDLDWGSPAAIFDRLAARSSAAKRKAGGELPVQTGPLLLDAAFLVPRSRAKSFQSLMAREAKSLGRHGYGVTLTGPWPPYSFVQD